MNKRSHQTLQLLIQQCHPKKRVSVVQHANRFSGFRRLHHLHLWDFIHPSRLFVELRLSMLFSSKLWLLLFLSSAGGVSKHACFEVVIIFFEEHTVWSGALGGREAIAGWTSADNVLRILGGIIADVRETTRHCDGGRR